MEASLYNLIHVDFSPVVNCLCVGLTFMNLDTNCQVLVIYKCYTFITVIFEVLKQRRMGPIDIYRQCNYAKSENTLLNNDLLDA